MKRLLSPKQVARALDVSESSVKRLCDKGVIPTQYTEGGHRRISMANLVDFVRSSKYELVRPEALELPTAGGKTERNVERACHQMTEALLAGHAAKCRQIVMDLYLAQHSASVICDEVLAAAFRQIGDRWACGEAEVYQERRGCEIASRVLHEFTSILLPAPDDAPLAIGCTPAGDQYSLGTTMAELVLRDVKWKSVSIGVNLPFETISAAIRDQKPALFWLSCSHIADEPGFLNGYGKLQEEFVNDVAFVLGGFALTNTVREKMKYSAYCDNMQHLEVFAKTLLSAIKKSPTPPSVQR